MTNTSDMVNGGTTGEARFAGQSSYRGLSRPHVGGLPGQPAGDGDRGKTVVADEMATMTVPTTVPPIEPVFPPDGWLDDEPTGSLADHPLLRGLLLELPPKGSVPQPDWLDRWFEAARSILDLLYLQSSAPGSHR